MIVYLAPPDTSHPHGPPTDEWVVLGAADDSTLPADGDDLLRLRLHERDEGIDLPCRSTAVWVPDLGVYHGDVSVDVDRTDVVTISERSHSDD